MLRLMIGLPSSNEAESIPRVTADVDAALSTLPVLAEATLVNVDNSTSEATVHAFLRTPTRAPKVVLSTSCHVGKGANTLALLNHMCERDFDALISVDTDLAGIPASWIHQMAVRLANGADACFPLRPAVWNGADLTYHLAYPVLAGVFGADLPEPLCGEIGLSRAMAEALLRHEWTAGEKRFGGDLLIAGLATKYDWHLLPLASARSNPGRSYRPGAGSTRMGEKFTHNLLATRALLARRTALLPPSHLPPHPHGPRSVTTPAPRNDPTITAVGHAAAKALQEHATAGNLEVLAPDLARDILRTATPTSGLAWSLWRDSLLTFLKSDTDASPKAEVMETLFLLRVVGHHHEIAGQRDWYPTVVGQAHDFFEYRHDLWTDTTPRGETTPEAT